MWSTRRIGSDQLSSDPGPLTHQSEPCLTQPCLRNNFKRRSKTNHLLVQAYPQVRKLDRMVFPCSQRTTLLSREEIASLCKSYPACRLKRALPMPKWPPFLKKKTYKATRQAHAPTDSHLARILRQLGLRASSEVVRIAAVFKESLQMVTGCPTSTTTSRHCHFSSTMRVDKDHNQARWPQTSLSYLREQGPMTGNKRPNQKLRVKLCKKEASPLQGHRTKQ